MIECVLVAGAAVMMLQDSNKTGMWVEFPELEYHEVRAIPIEGAAFKQVWEDDRFRVTVEKGEKLAEVVMLFEDPHDLSGSNRPSIWSDFTIPGFLKSCK